MKRILSLVIVIVLGLVGAAGALFMRMQVKASKMAADPPPVNAGTPPHWRAATDKEQQGAIHSIGQQLAAFKKNDYNQAVTFQSSTLKSHFPSVASFQQMIQTGYPEFAHYKSYHVDKTLADPNRHVVAVDISLLGEDGIKVSARYLMVLEQNIYRVDGVAVAPAAGPPAHAPAPLSV